MNGQPPREFTYSIDEKDVIRSFSKEWAGFAGENAAVGLPESVLGCSVWDFITDGETRHLYHVLFERARMDAAAVSVPFRCDAPDRRRFMRLEVVAAEDKWLDIKTELVREETRETVALLEVAREPSSDLLTMCGWCKKVHLDDGSWVEVEEAIESLHLFDDAHLPGITHSICPECKNSVMESLAIED